MNRLLVAFGVLVVSGVALGQLPAGWLISIDYGPGQTVISPRNPSCVVRVSGWFSRPDYALCAGVFSVLASEEGWSGNRGLAPMLAGASPGTIEGGTVKHVIGGQVHFPPNIHANPRNPMPFWEATWSATNFAARQVPVVTATSIFWVYPSPTSPQSQSRLAGLAEGQASIRVVPAPGALSILASAALLQRRRRPPGGPP